MSNVYVEPSPQGGYQIEFADGSATKTGYATQKDAIDAAVQMGHAHPIIGRVRDIGGDKHPDRFRSK